jgi:hypothetical protein
MEEKTRIIIQGTNFDKSRFTVQVPFDFSFEGIKEKDVLSAVADQVIEEQNLHPAKMKITTIIGRIKVLPKWSYRTFEITYPDPKEEDAQVVCEA